jgi:hypothetical protein
MHHREYYRPIFDFIADVGLSIAEAPLPKTTFLPGIAIRSGGLVVDPEALLWPSDLLHEAGHLAVLPAAVRASADDALIDVLGLEHAGESEAMAWAYAAASHIGLPMNVLIHEGGYKGRSTEILSMYAYGIYPGLRGLCETGMSAAPGFGAIDDGAIDDGVRYPQMRRWLRE